MRLLSTEDEREKLLQKLKMAELTPEIDSAIRIVEESIEFANLRELIVEMFEPNKTPDTLEGIVESGYVHHEMRAFAHMIDKIAANTRAQKFKEFYGYTVNSKGYYVKNDYIDKDDDGYKILR